MTEFLAEFTLAAWIPHVMGIFDEDFRVLVLRVST